MRKIYSIGNVLYLPIMSLDNTVQQKWIGASISGEIFINQIYTQNEIYAKFPDIRNYDDLHDVIAAWGTKIH